MNVKIVFIDDAAFALQRLKEHCSEDSGHWVLVACAPKITRRASRWGNRSTLDKWRNKWAKNLFEGLIPHSPLLQSARVSTHISEVSVQQMTAQLHAEHRRRRCSTGAAPRPSPSHHRPISCPAQPSWPARCSASWASALRWRLIERPTPHIAKKQPAGCFFYGCFMG